MPTWKKVIVSGSQAELAALSASIAVQVGTNQQITTAPATTFLSGSFSGSFRGDGSGLTGISATVYNPINLVNNIANTGSRFYISGSTSSDYITYIDLLTDLAGSNLTVESSDSLALSSSITNLTSVSATSFTGSLSGTATNATNATNTAITNQTTGTLFFPTFVASGSGNQPQLVNSSSLSYSAASNTITATASWATNAVTANTASYVLNAVSSSFASTASFLNTLNQTVNVNGAVSASGFNTTGNLFVGGNLQVAGVITGSATIITATNVAIQDQFVLLASGSAATVDAGIIVQNNTNGIGEALFWENNPITVGRWALSSSVSPTALTVTAAEYIVSAQIGTSTLPPSANPYYGGQFSGSGNMYINSVNGDIFIYS